jgi:hypothetical protein
MKQRARAKRTMSRMGDDILMRAVVRNVQRRLMERLIQKMDAHFMSLARKSMFSDLPPVPTTHKETA